MGKRLGLCARLAFGVWLFALPVRASDLAILDGGIRLRMDANATNVKGAMRLKNQGTDVLQVGIRAGKWTNNVTGTLTGAALLLSETSSGEFTPELAPSALKAGEIKTVWVEASAITAPGISEAPLWNGEDNFGAVRIERFDVPFNVKLDPSITEVLLGRRSKGFLTLANDDTTPYRVKWQFSLPEQGLAFYEGSTVIEAKGSQRVAMNVDDASPFTSWSWFSGILKDEVRNATLKLYLQPEEGVAPPHGVPVKTATVKTRLRYYSTFGPIINNLTLILVLFAGALFSIFVKLWLPNVRRKMALKEKLDKLAGVVTDFSTRLGVRPLVHLRVQHTHVSEMLGAPREVREWKMWPPSIKTGKRSIARWTFSPDFEDILKQCEASVERLTKQVALLSSLDNSALRMASLTSSTLPPSEIEAIEIAVERVLNLALPTDGADQDLQAVNNEVAQIANRVNQLEQYATAFRPQVQVRLNEVAAFFANLQPLAAGAAAGANTGTGGQQPAGGSAPFLVAAASHVRTDLPAPFLALSQFTNNEIPEAASFTALADLDADVYKLSLIQRYAQLNPNLNATNPAPLTKEALYPEVLKHLKLRSWDAIRTARGLLLQAEQGLYRDDVEEALKGGKERAFVGRDRLDIRPNTSVGLDLRFRREALNQASARDEFRCLWEFEHPDGTKYTLPDPCWNLSRYFPLAGLYKIRVLFEDWKGHPVVDDQGQPVVVSDQIYVTEAVPQRAGPRLRLELVGMFLALSPAVFALLTTAQEQVAQLEWYSGVGVVLALGFGIDTLKTLLAQKGTP